MIGDTSQVSERLCTCGMGERRRMERLYEPFPVKVRGVSAEGENFDIDTKVSDISAGGLYVTLPFRIDIGSRLFVVTRFSTVASVVPRGPLLAMNGRVTRVDPKSDSIFGVAVEFTSSRFL